MFWFGGSPVDVTSGTAPTPADFQTVLDNVLLPSSVPEPAPALVLAAGLAGVAWRRRALR